MTVSDRPVIALVPGDCTGIGPEQTAKLLAAGQMQSVARLVVIGDIRVLEAGATQAGVKLDLHRYQSPAAVDWEADGIPIVDLGNIDPSKLPIGVADPLSG